MQKGQTQKILFILFENCVKILFPTDGDVILLNCCGLAFPCCAYDSKWGALQGLEFLC